MGEVGDLEVNGDTCIENLTGILHNNIASQAFPMKADKGRGGKTTSGNGQAWSSASPRGQSRTGENGENWLQNYLWCPNDPRGKELMMMMMTAGPVYI